MDLVAEGEQLAGIESLTRAYELMPHPSVLYNIALAYTDLGLHRSAIDYFERYLESGPPDAATVRTLVEVLEAQLQAEEQAALEESAPAEGEGETAGASKDPRVDDLLARVDALVRSLEDPSDEEAGADLPSPELTSKTESIYDQVIVSASRQATNAVNAPAPTTIITAEEIRLSGATTVPEILRRVPGISVITAGAGHADIAIRGFNQRVSNKVLVLVDGRSVYLDFVGATFYRSMTVGIDDIERIEVIRGPGATLYGANAFGGVVNIITRQAGRNDEGQVQVRGGSGNVLGASGRFSGRRGGLAWRGSVGYEQANRFEREYGERVDLIASVEDPDLAVRTVRANGGLTLRPDEKTTVGLSGGVSYGYTSFLGIGVFRDYSLLGLQADSRLDLQVGGFGVRAFWNHTNATTGPTWQRAGDPDLHAQLMTHTLDVEALYSGTEWTGPLRHDLALGGGYRLKAVDWAFLSGAQLEQHLHGFIEDRVTFLPALSLVAGFRFDQHPLVGFTPSPRFALLIKPTAGQVIRISAGTAFRSPTFTESYADLIVPSSSVTGVALHAGSNTDLRPEQIASVQLGYRFEESAFFSFGVEGYYQQIFDLIEVGNIESDSALPERQGSVFVAGSSAFLNNEGVFHSLGAEVEVHAFPVDGLDLRASYSFSYVIDQAKKDAGDPDFRDRRHPWNSAHFGVSYRSPIGLEGNVDVHVVSAVSLPERNFDSTSGEVVIEECHGDHYGLVSARLGYRFASERFELGVTGYNLAGFATGGHREHCLASRVGARVLGTATYRF